MLIVRVELHSAVTGSVTELARMKISRVGGDDNLGAYLGQTFRGRTKDALDKEHEVHRATIYNYPRNRLHVWALVSQLLHNMGYKWELDV